MPVSNCFKNYSKKIIEKKQNFKNKERKKGFASDRDQPASRCHCQIILRFIKKKSLKKSKFKNKNKKRFRIRSRSASRCQCPNLFSVLLDPKWVLRYLFPQIEEEKEEEIKKKKGFASNRDQPVDASVPTSFLYCKHPR